MKLSQILSKINISATLTHDFELMGIAPLQEANEKQLSYIEQKQYLKDLNDSKAGAVLIRQEFSNLVPTHIQAIITPNPHLAFAQISHFFAKGEFLDEGEDACIHPSAKIMPNVYLGKNIRIGANSLIMPGVVISDHVIIGEDCKIYPNVVIYRDTIIGNRVNIHAGSVIGSDGFGYAHTTDGKHVKIEHNGCVVIEDDVEIGANNTIDRAVFGETKIQKGAKIDNLVQIGHNCVIGPHSILVSQVGLAGSTTTGRNVVMGGQAGTGGHIHIGDFVQVAGRGAVGKNLPPNTKWGGHPLMELDEWMKFYVNLRRMLKKKKD
ncbi:UDP-3-O-(3-hydroxymyristoyl)glucosamine N-acyltransferase [Helicobacter mustelae]|uniref:UDP-3-O-acylglucosamine N-acyltransferase n=1 Tax=Helicobacter mustelae (strain ATCC 43772 / CCUG 25715 / CIP 103759 / LMG 18044 / NCTC 12198 / R85-136P) TaxID=679897 RepID=D3UJB6_HELM1|nr:UDP-3-O-(3-hydroxymyristoyl)glucosamine N-acyltransferase [Helicobacter mustelae]CBG40591.1 UDP-3-O-[3-hydroxymyristoyl] glucosamine N-acyltransferase [Helicobacter mustelae 12198]SQH72088.1 UDP-3-O-[3-hydroxymyristoyl] glucosamine N-acyltransferase [Helicobacter mustelae]